MKPIVVRGARAHNLRNISLSFPFGGLSVMVGPSGSGKSSLAFDTLYAEARARYLDAFGLRDAARAYDLPRPDVDWIEGLPPAIAFAQRQAVPSGRSTLGTLCGAYDTLRSLFTLAATNHCKHCGHELSIASVDQIVDQVRALPPESPVLALALFKAQPEREWPTIIDSLKRSGFTRVRIDGQLQKLEDLRRVPAAVLEIELALDRFTLRRDETSRIAEAVELARTLEQGWVRFESETGAALSFSVSGRCLGCGQQGLGLSPQLFSFNHAEGACPACEGRGLSALDASHKSDIERAIDRELNVDVELGPCGECTGTRLRKEARAARLAGKGIAELSDLSLEKLLAFVEDLPKSLRERAGVAESVSKFSQELRLLNALRLGYLSLSRRAPTLSTGELQRIRLARHLSAELRGVLYVLDEPSAGLHPLDTQPVIAAIKEVRAAGNTVVAVDHAPALIEAADHIVELGPGAGSKGGQLVAEGAPQELKANPASPTGMYLNAGSPKGNASSRTPSEWIHWRGIEKNNLKQIDVAIPKRAWTAIVGVSGAGKTTLACEVIAESLRGAITRGASERFVMEGHHGIERVVEVEAQPIGFQRRSVLATYLEIFSEIRRHFAALPDARAKGFAAERFGFNKKGGRCEACQGLGVQELELPWLRELEAPCEVCLGRRYKRETLSVHYRGWSIADVLEMDVARALEAFEALPKIRRKLEAMRDIGLGYLELGRLIRNLSGGEAQRLKLAKELATLRSTPTLFVLDEPTRGLHFSDVAALCGVLQGLVDQGHTLVTVDHRPELIRQVDYVIELGPGAGPEGGQLIASGALNEITQNPESLIAPVF